MPTQRYKTSSRFETNLVTIDLSGNFKVTTKPLRFRYGPNKNDCHEVPAYKLTDGASSPWIAGPVGLERSELDKIGVLHDDMRDAWYCSNKLTDGYLYDAALSIGKSYWQSLILYYAVRIGTALKYETKFSAPLIDLGRDALADHLEIDPKQIIFNSTRKTYEII